MHSPSVATLGVGLETVGPVGTMITSGVAGISLSVVVSSGVVSGSVAVVSVTSMVVLVAIAVVAGAVVIGGVAGVAGVRVGGVGVAVVSVSVVVAGTSVDDSFDKFEGGSGAAISESVSVRSTFDFSGDFNGLGGASEEGSGECEFHGDLVLVI